jgi:putative glycosyltransferase (TIGR04348 family)
MARIAIVTPARAGARNGNRHTAKRWAALLRAAGHRVSVDTAWNGGPCDALVALHARRSHDSILDYREQSPTGPLVVVLTGTDLYKDLPASRPAQRSLELADLIVTLQPEARSKLSRKFQAKTRVVYQSSDASARHAPPKDRIRVTVVGHLRKEKDPFRTAFALSHVKRDLDVEVVQIGDALSPEFANQAKQHMKRDARYRWLGGRTHRQALGWIARSHALVVSSAMEGGANVICEAARIGTPVLASRISGNLGMLGRNYPGYFSLFDDKALGELMCKISADKKYRRKLKRALAVRRHLFAPSAERAALARVVREALARSRVESRP